MITIIFESHATTVDNEAGLAAGWADVALSEAGQMQAKQLGVRYAGRTFDAIFCSDLQRSYRTGEIAFGGRYTIVKDKRLRECDYGELTRAPKAQIESQKGSHIDTAFPGGESYKDTSARMKDFLQELLRGYDGKTVMIIGHRATQYGLEEHIRGLSLKETVLAPWKWQPGWKYRLKSVSKG
jgi:broad specificity phosphatase PhoE